MVGWREAYQEAVLAGGGGVGRRRQERDVGQCEVGRHGVRSRGVDRAARGRTGGTGSNGWCGRGGRAQSRSVGHAGFGWLVEPWNPGDK
jgi:hypothetical protein